MPFSFALCLSPYSLELILCIHKYSTLSLLAFLCLSELVLFISHLGESRVPACFINAQKHQSLSLSNSDVSFIAVVVLYHKYKNRIPIKKKKKKYVRETRHTRHVTQLSQYGNNHRGVSNLTHFYHEISCVCAS